MKINQLTLLGFSLLTVVPIFSTGGGSATTVSPAPSSAQSSLNMRVVNSGSPVYTPFSLVGARVHLHSRRPGIRRAQTCLGIGGGHDEGLQDYGDFVPLEVLSLKEEEPDFLIPVQQACFQGKVGAALTMLEEYKKNTTREERERPVQAAIFGPVGNMVLTEIRKTVEKDEEEKNIFALLDKGRFVFDIYAPPLIETGGVFYSELCNTAAAILLSKLDLLRESHDLSAFSLYCSALNSTGLKSTETRFLEWGENNIFSSKLNPRKWLELSRGNAFSNEKFSDRYMPVMREQLLDHLMDKKSVKNGYSLFCISELIEVLENEEWEELQEEGPSDLELLKRKLKQRQEEHQEWVKELEESQREEELRRHLEWDFPGAHYNPDLRSGKRLKPTIIEEGDSECPAYFAGSGNLKY